MPRIPEANFRTDPSVRVEQEARVQIDAGDTRRTRQLGSQFVKISDTLRNAKRTAEALNSADKVDQEFTKTIDPQLQQFANMSENGKIKDPVTGKEKDYSVAVQELIEKENNRALASFAGDTEAMSYYARYTKPKLDNAIAKARVFENKQIVDHRNRQIASQSELLVQKHIDGDLDDLDLAAHADKILSSSAVIGSQTSDRHLTSLYKNLAYQAPSLIKSQGYNEQNDARARKYFKYLDEAERREVTREYDVAVTQAKVNAEIKASRDINNIIDKANSFTAVRQASGKLQELGKDLLERPIDPEIVPPETRLNQIGKVQGRQLGFFTMGLNPNASLEEFRATAEQVYDDNFRNISGAAVDQLGADNIKQASIDQALSQFRAIDKKMRGTIGGAFEVFQDMDGRAAEDFASKNPNRITSAGQRANQFFQRMGIKAEFQTYVSPTTAQDLGKNWDEIYKGAPDASGDLQYKLFKDTVVDSYGEYSYKAADDMIRLSSGTKGGDPKIPPMVSFVTRIPQEGQGAAFTKELFGHKAQYKDHIAAITGDDGFFSQGVKSEADFTKIVKGAMASSPMNNVFFGKGGENNQLYAGAVESVQARAAWYSAKGKMPPMEAVQRALADVSEYTQVGKSGNSTVMVDRKFIEKTNAGPEELNVMTNHLKEMRFMDKMNVELAFDAMIGRAGDNAFIDSKQAILANIQDSALGDNKARQEFVDAFEENILWAVDPHNPNAVKGYLQPTNGEPIEILQSVTRTKADGTKERIGVKPLRIDLEQYYELSRDLDTQDIQRAELRRATGSRGAIGRFNRMAR